MWEFALMMCNGTKRIFILTLISSIVSLLPQVSIAESSGFKTPSGNIVCALEGTGENARLRCELRSYLNPKPPQPYPGYCQFDWGKGFSLPVSLKPSVLCISDTIFGGSYPVLKYNQTWRHQGFNCVSKRVGLTCTNLYGTGFFLSREKWRVIVSDNL